MGRRFEKKVTTDGAVALHERYLYRGYLQIAAVDLLANTTKHAILWDPTQPTATRPLAIQQGKAWYTYAWDLTKNIIALFTSKGAISTTYTYTPFGKVTAQGDTKQDIQWSSEYHDTETALVYYNYRYYNPTDGRWTRRDLIIYDYKNLYIYTYNNINKYVDYNGNKNIEITAGSFLDRIATPIMNFIHSLINIDVPNDYIFGPDTYVANRFWNMNTPLMNGLREYFEKYMDTYCHQTPLPEEPYYEERSDIVHTAPSQNFFRDVFTLAGIMDEGGRWMDFGIYMGGTFTYSFVAKIDCCTKIKTFDMVIYDEFTLASLTRNPITRNSFIDSRTIKSTMTIIIKKSGNIN